MPKTGSIHSDISIELRLLTDRQTQAQGQDSGCIASRGKNAGLEKSGLENVGPNHRGGKDGTGIHGTKAHGWKSQD